MKDKNISPSLTQIFTIATKDRNFTQRLELSLIRILMSYLYKHPVDKKSSNSLKNIIYFYKMKLQIGV